MRQDGTLSVDASAEREIDLTALEPRVEGVGREGAWVGTTQEVLAVLGRKWLVPVVGVLLEGPRRNFQLLCEIDAIQPKVLRETLRSLERDGLIERVLLNDDAGGKCIAYQLTRLGRSLPELLSSVFEWGARHLHEVHASREVDTKAEVVT